MNLKLNLRFVLVIIKIHETFKDIDLNNFNYDAFGEAYEKMIADELGNSSKRYGQYFTKRDLINFIINELNIKETEKCYDPACGSGGFILGFAKNFKNNLDFIKNNIYGQEILPEVHKTTSFNMIAHNTDGCLKIFFVVIQLMSHIIVLLKNIMMLLEQIPHLVCH